MSASFFNFKAFLGLLAVLLLAVVILFDPRFFMRSGYVATPLQATAHPAWAWTAGLTPEQMCDVMNGGDSREYRGRLLASYSHWYELFTQGKAPNTFTVICSFPGEHSTRYQRFDFVTKRGSYEREIVWHGYRQRGDVDVPPDAFFTFLKILNVRLNETLGKIP